MKNLTVFKIIIFSFFFLIFTNCSNLFEDDDITSNPNAVTNVDIRTLLSGTLLGMSILHEDTDVRIASLWSREINGFARAHLGFSQYIVASTNFSWKNLYPVAGQARLIQEKADIIGDKRIKGVGQVIEALVIAKATALYGDVPYSQAFNIDQFPNPIYDSQINVYSQLQTTLDNAIINLSATTGLAFANNDFIFNGNSTKWKQAAYTLKARLYLHTANYAMAIDAGNKGIATTNGDALVPHGQSQGIDINQNYDFFKVRFAGDVGFDGAYLPQLMQSRINSANIKTNETALFNHFTAIGLTAVGRLDANTVNGAFTNNAPHPILTFYENQLIIAEAYTRLGNENAAIIALNTVRTGLTGGYFNGKIFSTSGRLYENYVASDFVQNGLANPNNYSNPQIALLYEIISQRYIILLMQYESFNDYRRLSSAMPVVQLPIPLSVGTQKPQRFIYPESQINSNTNTPNPAPNQFTKVSIFQ